jgi:hypothetical protein
MRPTLYLEQRVGIVKEALNTESLEFADLLPKGEQARFNAWIRELMDVCLGYPRPTPNQEKP